MNRNKILDWLNALSIEWLEYLKEIQWCTGIHPIDIYFQCAGGYIGGVGLLEDNE